LNRREGRKGGREGGREQKEDREKEKRIEEMEDKCKCLGGMLPLNSGVIKDE
jgi:hypothetical protein